ncbi:MAG: DUF2147 domain-containing protein [Spirochaetaceae bacterium]|nr:DUF2147 domain-containing protein [Spirochaetaceae bacterium]
MKKTVVIFIVFLFVAAGAMAAENVVGLWRGVDENTGDSTIFAYIYEYHEKLYGRIIVTFDEGVMKDFINNPGKKADLWVGDPFYAGMDIIWDMEDRGNKWKKGRICDPKEGKIYASEMWLDGENLIVRGKIGPFGRNQTWQPLVSSDLPPGLDYGNPSSWIPVIPDLK